MNLMQHKQSITVAMGLYYFHKEKLNPLNSSYRSGIERAYNNDDYF